MPSILEGVFSSSEDELNKMLMSLVGMPKEEIEAELSIIKSRVEEVAQTIPTKGNKGDKGDKGDQGIQGPKGEPGRDGRDGYQGKDGKQGIDGKAGLDGKDGVSIVDVNVAFDNHLVVTLSDGTEIDAGVIGSIGDNLQNVVANYVSNGANGTLIYKGLWNASTNNPTLSLSSSDAGAYYVVSVAGSTNLSGITDWQVNDWAIFNGTAWQKIDNSDLFNASAVAITGGAIDGTTIGSTTPSTGKFTTLSSTQQTNLATSSGNVQVGSTTATEKLDVSGGGMIIRGTTNQTASNGGLYLGTSGSTSTLTAINPAVQWFNMNFAASQFSFLPQNAEQFRISHTASAVNYVQVTGAATGSFPRISTQGSDSAASLALTAKSGTIWLETVSGFGQVGVTHTAGANNYLALTGGVNNPPVISSASGTNANIPLAFISKGTGAINIAAGSSGVNISNGGTVTAITRTNPYTVAYTSIPSVVISAPTTAGGVQATATCQGVTIGATPVSGGTGYTVNDLLTVTGLSGTNQITVTSVSAGVITAATITGVGYATVPSNPVSVTGGTGSGATFNLTYQVGSSFTITNAGSGYIEQPTVTFSGGGGSGAAAYATVGSNVSLKTLGTNLSFNMPGGEQVRIGDTYGGGSATNYFALQGRVSNSPVFSVAGADTNIGMVTTSKGTGSLTFWTANFGSQQFQISHTASAVNYVQVTGGATGSGATISTQGSDANAFLALSSKGTSALRLQTGGSSQVLISNTTSAVNQIGLTGSTAGIAPVISSTGGDTNIDLALTPKGTGLVRFGTYTAGAPTATGYINIKAADGTTYKVLVST